jgi:hypothetical protein
MRHLICASALGLLLLTPARAQETAPAAAAEANAAQTIIAAAGAEGVFTSVASAHVRHTGSGMLCRFAEDGQGGRIILFPGLQRGDDVACEFADNGQNIRLHATRLPRAATLDEAMAAAQDAFRRATPAAQPYSAPILIAASAAAPASGSAQFLVPGENGARDYVRLSVALRDRWLIKMRLRAAAGDETALARLAERSELIWRGALADIAR